MPALNSFEAAHKKHNTITSHQPVGRTALVNSLRNLEAAGHASVKDGAIGTVALATSMLAVFNNVADLEVKPPLSDAHQTEIQTKISTYSLLAEANQPGPGDGQPTDIEKIDTGKRKA